MSKLGKTLTFIGISGAALAGLWYFMTNIKKSEDVECETEEDEEEIEDTTRSYVSLDPVADDRAEREALQKAVESAVSESIAKAEEAADGVGLVKGVNEASDFEFESFDEK